VEFFFAAFFSSVVFDLLSCRYVGVFTGAADHFVASDSASRSAAPLLYFFAGTLRCLVFFL